MTDERQLLDEFKREIMSEFIIMCKGNDFKKLTLLKIGDTIDRIYEKYSALPSTYAVEVVRCKDCRHWVVNDDVGYCDNPDGLDNYARPEDFCSYGERKDGE